MKMSMSSIATTSFFVRPITSCPPGFVARIKFYDLYSLFLAYVKHGNLLKASYFILLPLGIYLILTNTLFKKPNLAKKIICLLIGVLVALIIYFAVPSVYVCSFKATYLLVDPSTLSFFV